MSSARSLPMDGSSTWLCAGEEVMLRAHISVPSLPGGTPLMAFSWSWELPFLFWGRNHNFWLLPVACGLLAGWLPQVCICLLDQTVLLEALKEQTVPQGPPSPPTSPSSAQSLFWFARSRQMPGISPHPKQGLCFCPLLPRQQDHADLVLGHMARWMVLLIPLVRATR